jgi:hypothetical protein
MALHEDLSAHRERVLNRWAEIVRGTLVPATMSNPEIVDHLPQFLSAVIVALREDAGLDSAGPNPEESDTAAIHGEQRLRLGFSLDAVVREYGALEESIVETARSTGAEITFRELKVVSNAIIAGIAQAVSEYTRQRDAEQLRQANEHFAFIAHELRNPLSTATIAFELLEKRGQLPADSRAVVSLKRSLQRTSELMEQTLRIARVASGIELRRERTTLRELCQDAQLEIIGEADAREVELVIVVEHEDGLDLDVRLVRSALGNLVRNGVKYTHAGGCVELRASFTNGRAVFEVADHCGGLPAGMVETAFAPFVRHDRREGGFGLGLAIAKQAADAHGGTIRVQNVPGTGCIFVLELPVVAAPTTKRTDEGEPGVSRPGPLRSG